MSATASAPREGEVCIAWMLKTKSQPAWVMASSSSIASSSLTVSSRFQVRLAGPPLPRPAVRGRFARVAQVAKLARRRVRLRFLEGALRVLAAELVRRPLTGSRSFVDEIPVKELCRRGHGGLPVRTRRLEEADGRLRTAEEPGSASPTWRQPASTNRLLRGGSLSRNAVHGLPFGKRLEPDGRQPPG